MNLSVYQGWTQILIPRPQPQPLLEAIRKFRPTFAPLVPTMYIGMLNHPDLKKTDMSCIRGAFSGSAPLPVEVIHDFEKMTGAIIVEGFGLTETTPVTHINPFGGVRKVGSIGIPISDTQCRIVSLDDGVTDVPLGEPGEADHQGTAGHEGLQGHAGRNGEHPSGWLVIYGGYRYDGSGRILLHRGPEEGHDYLRRLQYLPTGY